MIDKVLIVESDESLVAKRQYYRQFVNVRQVLLASGGSLNRMGI